MIWQTMLGNHDELIDKAFRNSVPFQFILRILILIIFYQWQSHTPGSNVHPCWSQLPPLMVSIGLLRWLNYRQSVTNMSEDQGLQKPPRCSNFSLNMPTTIEVCARQVTPKTAANVSMSTTMATPRTSTRPSTVQRMTELPWKHKRKGLKMLEKLRQEMLQQPIQKQQHRQQKQAVLSPAFKVHTPTNEHDSSSIGSDRAQPCSW